MRVFVSAVLITLLCAGVDSQSVAAFSASDEEADVVLTTDLISIAYCSFREETLVSVGFRLHFKIQNRGRKALILCRKYLRPGDAMLFYPQADGTAGDAAYSMFGDTFGVFDRDFPKSLKRGYAVVQPQSSLEFDRDTGVLVTPSDRVKRKSFPPPGAYLLQATLDTWEGPPDIPSVLQGKWNEVGVLITRRLEANLIPVRIAPPEKLPNCEK